MENIYLLINNYLIPLNFKILESDLNGFVEYTFIGDKLSYKIYIHQESNLNKMYIFEGHFAHMKLKEDNYYRIIELLKTNFKRELRKIKIERLKNE
jgi:hypothetical protein